MEGQANRSLFKSGLGLCVASLFCTFVGLLGMSGGPCGGPSSTLGSVILFGAGLGCLGAAVYGITRIVRGWSGTPDLMKFFGGLSVLGALVAVAAGSLYVLIGFVSFLSFV
jgi:hypothetical protein